MEPRTSWIRATQKSSPRVGQGGERSEPGEDSPYCALISNRSTSKMSVAFGGILGGLPVAP